MTPEVTPKVTPKVMPKAKSTPAAPPQTFFFGGISSKITSGHFSPAPSSPPTPSLPPPARSLPTPFGVPAAPPHSRPPLCGHGGVILGRVRDAPGAPCSHRCLTPRSYTACTPQHPPLLGEKRLLLGLGETEKKNRETQEGHGLQAPFCESFQPILGFFLPFRTLFSYLLHRRPPIRGWGHRRPYGGSGIPLLPFLGQRARGISGKMGNPPLPCLAFSFRAAFPLPERRRGL